MRGFTIPVPQNLGGVAILLVVFAVISQAAVGETNKECDRDNTCWYVTPGTVTFRVRSWRCLWIWKCWTYSVSIGESEQVCRCCPGWQGDASNCQRCPEGRFGSNCDTKCECEDERQTQCDPRNGECYSHNGTLGQTFIDNCSSMNCTKGQICNRDNNTCECPPMWRGEACDTHSMCPDGLYGLACKQKCECNNGTSHCDVVTGTCMCYRGWQGPTCNETCPPQYYGENCSMACDCPLNASECHPVSGDCLCPAGFHGRSCSTECPDGRFGPSCQSPCTCDNSTETCNRINGTCSDKDDPDVLANDDDSLSNNSLVGPVVGAIVASIILVALLILFLVRRSKQANQRRDTLAVKASDGMTDNPAYEHTMNLEADTTSSHTPHQHFVVGGAIYAMPDNATRDSSSCNVAEVGQGFEDSYSHLRLTTGGDCINPKHQDEQNDYSHLKRNDQGALHTSRQADSALVGQSKANVYNNLNRGVEQPMGIRDKNKYEVLISPKKSSEMEVQTMKN